MFEIGPDMPGRGTVHRAAWGSYEAARARLGDYVKQGLYLHTPMVVTETLTLGFEEMFREEGPGMRLTSRPWRFMIAAASQQRAPRRRLRI
ncbi:hypothetical protein [Polyangium fumosum]|uniref:Uncharacterized protein n=1 Tax=Polyangium fumosum TaxID=889272 RepID=A0A4V6WQV2_9BACT|nr:hypothetical protein [Polyangium fumosum]TKD13243.1 hypothetical protein E8A74_01440 [Polyangium fumosum]